MAKYQGFKNWNHWNVSLWINNDEGLYRLASGLIAECGSKARAAAEMVDLLRLDGVTATPDGAPYSVSAVRAAMAGM